MTAITEGAHTGSPATMSGVNLHDIINRAELAAALGGGHVRQQVHPTEPLAILNYTEACAYEEAWTPTTLACRGLIWRTDTGQVVARGFTKFFNHEQPGAPVIRLDAWVHAIDKVDGSLGIVYPLPSGGWAVATRGSFTSDQAIHATALLNSRYAGYRPINGYTTLVEIVYPGNRIVIDYAGMDDLVLLGAVNNATGEPVPASSTLAGWPGPFAETLHMGTFAEVLAMPTRPNAEGVVVLETATGLMVKIKQADYVALHRIVTGLNARTVWEHLAAGKPLNELVEPLPDEFHPWVRQVADDLWARVDAIECAARAYFVEICEEVWGTAGDFARPAVPDPRSVSRADRKAFAALAVQRPRSGLLFALLDGRDITPKIWPEVRPEAFLTPTGHTYGEDTA
jgi:RNA ligase